MKSYIEIGNVRYRIVEKTMDVLVPDHAPLHQGDMITERQTFFVLERMEFDSYVDSEPMSSLGLPKPNKTRTFRKG